MAVRIRLKKVGRRHQPCYRICVMDSRSPRDGREIEVVGTYDPLVREKDKRVTMRSDRIDYWIGVGAKPTDKVQVLIDKFKGKVPEIRRDEPKARQVLPPAPPRPPRPKPQPQAEPAAIAPPGDSAAEEPAPAAPAEAPAEQPAAEAPKE